MFSGISWAEIVFVSMRVNLIRLSDVLFNTFTTGYEVTGIHHFASDI